ncbi:ribonuclease III [Alkaliflexus imshenetskii]|uniref:ribonuclease III n=1 Tax=Alkaliflexus imshenetskii TaxID=286730 RepID=UPI001F1DF154|nr:ribonuclease III [Alkaliflexus imshenetskii]
MKSILISLKLLVRKDRKFYCLIKKITGITPVNAHYYHLAFLHKSLMRKDEQGAPLNNERLEYLGDAVLSAVVAHELFLRFPEKDEGALTKMRSRIVNRHNMNQLALKMGLNQLIRTQPLADMAQTHIPGDALEALIGAIYLDRGYKQTYRFILKKIINKQPNLISFVENDTNFKSLLIEWGQKNKCNIHFVTEEYPSQLANEMIFVAQAFINNKMLGEGEGSSKKEAQQNAACKALSNVSEIRELSLN